ncbi:MAG: sulfatase-like hydrolase/transferase [Myxococcota bacterium]
MSRDGAAVARPLMAGLGLALIEVAWIALAARETFGGAAEWLRFALASATGSVAVCMAAWALGSGAVRLAGAVGTEPDAWRRRRSARATAWLVACVSLVVLAALLWELTGGRRLRDATLRPWAVVVASAGGAALVGWVVAATVERVRRGSWGKGGPAVAWASVAVGALVLDGSILRRLYPELHLLLTMAGVGALLLAAVLVPVRQTPPPRAWAVVTALLLLATAPLALRALMAHGNAAFVAEGWAPLTGKLVAGVRRARSPSRPAVVTAPEPRHVPPAGRRPGVDLSGGSVLVITVDALRADRLRAYGGEGLTPHMDALAEDAAVFLHAYTPTPHTSYALASLWTGLDVRAAGELSRPLPSEGTVADRVRRHGYRTAAFYPPAIFHVDSERFAPLAETGFGFEHREVDHAPADRRAQRVGAYLQGVDPESPLFVWVHLFEPHEPYDPPPSFARGDGVAARYDGEVAAADAAVGALVSRFRRHRPEGTVILTADHGEELGDHGGSYHGTTLYEEQVRVPLLWSSPGRVPARLVRDPVEITDVAGTLLPALGVPPAAPMQADDLGAVLAGRGEGPRHAFASIGETRLATDGRFKAMCTVGRPSCRLYDLARDPHEQRNAADVHPEAVARLRGAMGRHLAALADRGDTGDAPALLDRARLGDPTVGPSLPPLLGSADASVRAGAARALGRLGQAGALPLLRRLADQDPEATVRAEAAVAALRLDDRDMLPHVRRWLQAHRASRAGGAVDDLGWRAARALADAGDGGGAPELIAVAADARREAEVRREAVTALGATGARSAVPALVDHLGDIDLRIAAARALGRLGDRRAIRPLVRQLRVETYPEARETEIDALRALGAPGVEGLARRYLGSSPRR